VDILTAKSVDLG